MRTGHRTRDRGAFTITEMVFFGGIAMMVLLAIFGLMSRSTRILEIGRRTSTAQNDLRFVLERLAEDANELVFIDENDWKFDSTGGDAPAKGLTFFVRSSRQEYGASDAKEGLRKIEYTVEGSGTLKSVRRKVTAMKDKATADGELSNRLLVENALAHLKVWTLAIVPNPANTAPFYKLTLPGETGTDKPGASVACFVVDASAGESLDDSSDKAMDKQPASRIVTRLWCRNRVLEVARGALR